MSARPRVPRLAEWLASISVPESDRASLLGDLEERFSRRAAVRGDSAARRWYRGQVLRIALMLWPRRVLSLVVRLAAPGTARVAARSLLRSPASSLACVVTLAIGIAAPVSMFALADGVTSSLPGDLDDRVVRVNRIHASGKLEMGFPWPTVEALRDGAAGPSHPLTALAAYRSAGQVAVGDGEVPAGRFWGAHATSDLFGLLGVEPVLGRLYVDGAGEDLPAALIREDLWEERFDRDPAALGRVLRIDGVDHTVVGVLPRRFGFPVDHRIWMQYSGDEDEAWSLVGQLASTASSALARDHLESVRSASSLVLAGEGQVPPDLHVERYPAAHFSDVRLDRTTRRVGIASLILVILTGANGAAVMFARGMARSREAAVRLALGGSRAQVMALTLMETLFLAVAGGTFGLLLGHAALQAMVRYLTSQATIVPYWMDFGMGARSMILAGLLALVALAAAGVPPAIRSSRTNVDGALRLRPHEGRGGARRAMTAVVGLEVMLACFLLAMSSPVIDEGLTQLRTGAAFPTEDIVTGHFALEPPAYRDEDGRRTQLARVLEALRAEPAVGSATLTSALPGKAGTIRPAGPMDGIDDPATLPPAQVRSVGADFFELFGLSASAGRLLSTGDRASDEAVAVVNEAFARRYGGVQDVLGRRIVVDRLAGREEHEARVVGVVEDRGVTPHVGGRPGPGVYLSSDQVPPVGAYVLVRTRDGATLPQVWHRAVGPIDPYLPLGDVLSLEETLRRGHGAATLFTSVFLTLDVMTLLVVLVGLHGVHSFSMARRVRELGVRRALGASSGQVLRDGTRRGLSPVWVGVLIGTPPGFLAAKAVVPVEPTIFTLLLPPTLMVVGSILVVWRSTRRASRADPMEALRNG